MELLADRDPEEARKILDPVLERMMEAVHRYEGTVNQVMGDGIMALFDVRIFSARCWGVYDWGEPNFGSASMGAGVSDLPQPPQNFSLPSFRKPHDGHVEANERPHSPQNRRPSRFSAWHRGHCLSEPPSELGPGTVGPGGESLIGERSLVKDTYRAI